MNDLISVIVPVYNTEEFLRTCVQSITAQTYTNIEIILVDDGSSDNSGLICDQLAGEDGRIKVLHKQNGGAAMARYDALRIAGGKYCTFIDSDDCVDSDCIEILYNAICEFSAQLATCGSREVSFDKTETNLFTFDSGIVCVSREETFNMIFYKKKVSTALCGKMFITDILKSIKPKEFKLGEDSYVCIKYILLCNRIVHTGVAKYSYIQRRNSAVHTLVGEKRYDYVCLYDSFNDDFNSVCPNARNAYINKLVEDNFVTYLSLSEDKAQSGDKISHIEDNIKKYRKQIIKDGNAELRTRAACLLSYFGMPTVGMCYKIFDKIKK